MWEWIVILLVIGILLLIPSWTIGTAIIQRNRGNCLLKMIIEYDETEESFEKIRLLVKKCYFYTDRPMVRPRNKVIDKNLLELKKYMRICEDDTSERIIINIQDILTSEE